MLSKIQKGIIEYVDPKFQRYTKPLLLSTIVFVIVFALILIQPIFLVVHPGSCPEKTGILDQYQLVNNNNLDVSCIHWIRQLNPDSSVTSCTPTVPLPHSYCNSQAQSDATSNVACTGSNPLLYLSYGACPPSSSSFGSAFGYKHILTIVVGFIIIALLSQCHAIKIAEPESEPPKISFFEKIKNAIKKAIDATYLKFNRPLLVGFTVFLISYGACFGIFAALATNCVNGLSMADQSQLSVSSGSSHITCLDWVAQVVVASGAVGSCIPTVTLAFPWCSGTSFSTASCTSSDPLLLYSYQSCPDKFASLGQALGYASSIQVAVGIIIIFLYKKFKWIDLTEEKKKEPPIKTTFIEKMEAKFIDFVHAKYERYTHPVLLSVITFLISFTACMIIYGASTSKCGYGLNSSDQYQLSLPGNDLGNDITCLEWTAQVTTTANVGSCVTDDATNKVVYPKCADSTFFNSTQSTCTGSNPLIFYEYKTCPSSLSAVGAALGYRDLIDMVLGVVVIFTFKTLGIIKKKPKSKDKKSVDDPENAKVGIENAKVETENAKVLHQNTQHPEGLVVKNSPPTA